MKKTEDVVSASFHLKANVVQWIGANGRKWKAKLLKQSYDVLHNLSVVFFYIYIYTYAYQLHAYQIQRSLCSQTD